MTSKGRFKVDPISNTVKTNVKPVMTPNLFGGSLIQFSHHKGPKSMPSPTITIMILVVVALPMELWYTIVSD